MQNTNQHIAALLMILAVCGVAHGDGKFFFSEKVPVGVPYQRAILMHENGKETLILQSQYEIAEGETSPTLAWVVPVPTLPEIASMDADMARRHFWFLGLRTRPTVIPVFTVTIGIAVLVLVSLVAARLTTAFAVKVLGFDEKSFVVSGMRVTIGVLLFALLAFSCLMPTMGTKGVDVLKSVSVGIYDVTVLRAEDAATIGEWLSNNGFTYSQDDEPVFNGYISKGWCFVAAKVHRTADPNLPEVISSGLAAPLILRFSSNDAVYPLALTATVGSDTEILLYVFAEHKMQSDGRLSLKYAGQSGLPFDNNDAYVYPAGFFGPRDSQVFYLTKFKGVLTPEQMRDDLVFTKGKDDRPYRAIEWK